MPEVATKRRPGRPKKNTKAASEIISSLFDPKSSQNDDSNSSDEETLDIIDDLQAAPINNLHDTTLEDKMTNTHEENIKETIDNPTWASKLKPSAKGMSLSFVDVAHDSITIELEDIDSEINFWSTTLVGSFIGTKHSLSSVRTYVKQFWNAVSPPDVLYYKKGWFYFKFASEEDCLTILHGGPWVFGNSSLILKKWSPDFCSQLESIRVVPVWTLFPDLDPCFWSSAALSKIASVIGKPLYADPYTTEKTRISFARVLIDIDISKELTTSIKMNTPYGLKEVTVDYEWVPHFCSLCDCIGHSSSKCRKQKTTAPAMKQVWKQVSKTSGNESNGNEVPCDHASFKGGLQENIVSEFNAHDQTDSQELPEVAFTHAQTVSQMNVVENEFTKVRKRNSSPGTKQDSLQGVLNSNSFSVLAFTETDDDHDMMERGGTSQPPPC